MEALPSSEFEDWITFLTDEAENRALAEEAAKLGITVERWRELKAEMDEESAREAAKAEARQNDDGGG